MAEGQGKLYVVSTPIGNLEDITFRALRILKEVDLVAAEDTRRTRGLLSHFDISKPLTSFFKGNEEQKGEALCERIRKGESVALVSDAGTPGISDPAYSLIRKAIEEEIEVIPIPGPAAVISALLASGLPTDRFFFEGFLPRKSGRRAKRINAWKEMECTVAFYESPYRVVKVLKEIHEILGERQAAMAREITKLHEEILRGPLSEIIPLLEKRSLKGEVTLVIGGEEE